MAKKGIETSMIYVCPFCNGNVWFNREYDLVNHLLKEKDHLKYALVNFAIMQKTKVRKAFQKWCKE